jgi:hypothetical protein
VILGVPWIFLALIAAFWVKLAALYPWVKPYLPQLRVGILALCAVSLLVVVLGILAIVFREEPDQRRF